MKIMKMQRLLQPHGRHSLLFSFQWPKLCGCARNMNKSTNHHLQVIIKQAQAIVSEWSKEIHACNVRKAAVMATMTYNCEYTPSSDDARYPRLKTLDKTTGGLASTVTQTTPTMEAIADWGVEAKSLGHGFRANQQPVMPFYQAYQEVRNCI